MLRQMKLYKVHEIYITLWTTMILVLLKIFDNQKSLLYIFKKCLEFSIEFSTVIFKVRILFLSRIYWVKVTFVQFQVYSA